MSLLYLTPALILLTGCAAAPVAAPPQIVTITKIMYQPIPAAYLVACMVPRGTPQTNGDLLLLQQATLADLLACNVQLLKIKAITPPQ